MDTYCMYLRKSRSDLQSELLGGGDVLARHRQTLTELARAHNYVIGEVYAEVASGDSIENRPEMKRLLEDVKAGRWTGVLVMDIDRLGRGDSVDQTIILTNFLYSGTLIITPGKVYNLADDADQDQGEFKLLFARMEYKAIKRRLYAGRERSAADGWYIGCVTPYGYKQIRQNGRPTLEIIPEQAEYVRMMYRWYADGYGKNTIADKLNAIGSRTNAGRLWIPSTVWTILSNPLYNGKIRWGNRVGKPVYQDGQKLVKRPKNDNPIIAEGRHEAIIDDELWSQVHTRMQGNLAPHTKYGELANPLAGLVYCKRCGKAMNRHLGPSHKPDVPPLQTIRCPNRQCDQYAIRLSVLESVILDQLKPYAVEPAALPEEQVKRQAARKASADAVRKALDQADSQIDRLHDLLEQGVYDYDTFARRRAQLIDRKAALQAELDALEYDPAAKQLAALRALAPRARQVLEAYSRAATPAAKNELLKAVIARVEYNRTCRTYRNTPPDAGLEITIYPLLTD